MTCKGIIELRIELLPTNELASNSLLRKDFADELLRAYCAAFPEIEKQLSEHLCVDARLSAAYKIGNPIPGGGMIETIIAARKAA